MQTSFLDQTVLDTQPTVINCFSQPNYLIKQNSSPILSTDNVKSLNSQIYATGNHIRDSVEEMTDSTNKDMLI
jgi:hypothetical protein